MKTTPSRYRVHCEKGGGHFGERPGVVQPKRDEERNLGGKRRRGKREGGGVPIIVKEAKHAAGEKARKGTNGEKHPSPNPQAGSSRKGKKARERPGPGRGKREKKTTLLNNPTLDQKEDSK